MSEDERQDIPAGSGHRPLRKSLTRWGGGLVLAACVAFIGDRLVQLEPVQLMRVASWHLGCAMLAASGLFALSDKLLASAWSSLTNADGVVTPRRIDAIYGRGVLAKYLPGSVFQYASRQVEGASAGLSHARLGKASIGEIALHLPASMIAAGFGLAAVEVPVMASLSGIGAAFVALRTRNRILRAAVLQFGAFLCFAASAAVIGEVLLPASASGMGLFPALFLLSWLAGFLVPVAPGGLGVREAALIALASTQFPDAPLLASVLALRIASIFGDVLFGAVALWRSRERIKRCSSIKSP